jgi:hypothetical protein
MRFTRHQVIPLLENEDTLASVLMTILLDAYGEELYDKDPVELWTDIRADFGVVLPERLENRINAARMAITTDLFYEDALACRSISLALYSGELGDMVTGVLEPVEYYEILWAIYEVGLMRGDEEQFSPEVAEWIDKVQSDTAEDNEALEDATAVATVSVRFLAETIEALKAQLLELGLNDSEIEAALAA